MPLHNVLLGSFIHNVELNPKQEGHFLKSTGNYAQLIAKDCNFNVLKLSSSEVKIFNENCFATIDQVGNIKFNGTTPEKSGRRRWLG